MVVDVSPQQGQVDRLVARLTKPLQNGVARLGGVRSLGTGVAVDGAL